MEEQGQEEGEMHSQGVIRTEWNNQLASWRESLNQTWVLGRHSLAERSGGLVMVPSGQERELIPTPTPTPGLEAFLCSH